MNKQAYINGFVKRANEYGLTDFQATSLLKQSVDLGGLIKQASPETEALMQQLGKTVGDAKNTFKDAVNFGANSVSDTASSVGNSLGKDLSDIKGVLDSARHGFSSGVFRSQHPITNDIPLLGDAADFLINHDIDPIHAAAGASALGGGYLLHKLLNRKKQEKAAAIKHANTVPGQMRGALTPPKISGNYAARLARGDNPGEAYIQQNASLLDKLRGGPNVPYAAASSPDMAGPGWTGERVPVGKHTLMGDAKLHIGDANPTAINPLGYSHAAVADQMLKNQAKATPGAAGDYLRNAQAIQATTPR